MFGYLVILFTILPAAELALLIRIGQHIGAGNTFLIIVITGVLGAYLARLQGFFILQRIQESLSRDEMPTEEMLDGLMVFVGGIVLLTPGFITDILGFLLLIPLTRDIIKLLVRKKFQSAIRSAEHISAYSSQKNQSKFNDQDAEDADFR